MRSASASSARRPSSRRLGPDAFGHCGVAASLGLADPRSGLAYGYVRRRFAFPGGTAPENARLIQALADAADKAA